MSKTKKDAEKVEKAPKAPKKMPRKAPKPAKDPKQEALPFGKLSGTVIDHPDLGK